MSLLKPEVGMLEQIFRNQQHNWNYFVPSHIAYQTQTDTQINTHYIGYGSTLKAETFSSLNIGEDGLLVPVDPPHLLTILPPDHKTAKMVDKGEVAVAENTLEDFAIILWLAEISNRYGGNNIYRQPYFTVGLKGNRYIVSGLQMRLDETMAPLFSGSMIPLMGGEFLGEISLLMVEQQNNPSSAAPAALIPTGWIQALGFEERDVGYEKKKAISSDQLEVGHWYALPAGRLGLFCGYVDTDHYVFMERQSGHGKILNDPETAQWLDRLLNSRYHWGNIKVKKIRRSSYNQRIAKYSEDFKRVLDYCERELGERPHPTQADAAAAAAAAPPTP